MLEGFISLHLEEIDVCCGYQPCSRVTFLLFIPCLDKGVAQVGLWYKPACISLKRMTDCPRFFRRGWSFALLILSMGWSTCFSQWSAKTESCVSQRLDGEIGNYLRRNWQRAEHVPMAVTFNKEVGRKSSPIFTFLYILQSSENETRVIGKTSGPCIKVWPPCRGVSDFAAYGFGCWLVTCLRLCLFPVALSFSQYRLKFSSVYTWPYWANGLKNALKALWTNTFSDASDLHETSTWCKWGFVALWTMLLK